MSYSTVIKEIKKGKISPIYLLYGKETYFIEKVRQDIIKKLSAFINDELTTYDLDSVSIQEVIADAETIPFLNEKKLIVAYNPSFLLARQGRIPVTHDLDQLVSYLQNPPEFTTLIFIGTYEKLDNRKKITKEFNEHATVLQCEPVKQYELTKWIDYISKEYMITFDRDAKAVIEEELSPNLSILHNEIEKMAHYVGENGRVTKGLVTELMSTSSDTSALQLVDAVLNRDLFKALTIYKTLEKMNEEEIGMLALLAYQFRMIFQVKLLKDKGYSDQQVTKEMRVHPYVVKLASTRARRFSVERLEGILNMFADTDTAIKQGKMDKSIAFELLLYNLIEK